MFVVQYDEIQLYNLQDEHRSPPTYTCITQYTCVYNPLSMYRDLILENPLHLTLFVIKPLVNLL